uniref:Gustatory receptor n=1 Tax=Panagrolaimus superbus TaxID=310955 RepID=A0A914Z4T1_9BILA
MQIGGISFAIFCNYHNTERELFHIITISTDFIELILLACLVLYNRHLRNISLQRLELSQRFQVLENIRSLRAVFGLVFIGAVYNLFLSGAIVIARHLEYAMKYVSAIFFLGPIGFLFFQFVVAYNVNPNFRRRFKCFFDVIFGKNVLHHPHHENVTQIKNAFGKIIIVQDTITDHFDKLKKQWN